MTTSAPPGPKDDDLRQAETAMRRAALRARELAKQTDTALIIRRNGVVEAVRDAPVTTPAASPTAPDSDPTP